MPRKKTHADGEGAAAPSQDAHTDAAAGKRADSSTDKPAATNSAENVTLLDAAAHVQTGESSADQPAAEKTKKRKRREGEQDASRDAHDDDAEGTATATKEKKKKKKKRKEQEGDGNENGDGGEADLLEKKRRKKEKKEKKAAAAAAAAAAADTAPATQHETTEVTLQSNSAAGDRQTSDSASPLPELRAFSLPEVRASPLLSASAVQANAPDLENIDPALWGSTATAQPATTVSSSAAPPAGGGSAPAARGGSTPGAATSILPRDPSMQPIAPPRSSNAARGESINPSTVPPDEGASSTAPKKRGRPKKVVSEAGIIPSAPSSSAAPQRIAPTPTAPTAPDTAASRSSNAPNARPPAASSVVPSLAPPSSSPQRSTPTTLPVQPPSSRQQAQPSMMSTAPLPLLAGINSNTAARAAMNPNFVPATLPEGTTPLYPSENTLEHQEMLAIKWMSTKEMAELIETKGLKVRTGKFSKAEDAALKLCIENYRQQQGLTEEQIEGIIYAKGRNTRADYGDFWTILTRAVPDRALMSVYHHTKRLMQVEARKGPWTEEEDEKLKAAHKQFGPQWIKVSALVGRWENDCRDRWRGYVGPNEKILKGKWSKEEEDKLRQCVQEVKYDIYKFKKENERVNGEPIEDEPPGGSDMFWSRVASKMETRSRHQCRIKWNDNMRNKLLTSDGKAIRWAKRDTFIFIMKLASLQLTDEDEIAWKLLPDPHWNWWSPHVLHKRWGSMKNRAKKHLNNDKASYKEIIAWLKKEQESIPRKEVKAFMAKRPGEAGKDDDNDDNGENGDDTNNDDDSDGRGGDDQDGDGEDVDDIPPRQGNQRKSVSASRDIANNALTAADSSQAASTRKKGPNGKDQSQFRTNEFINSSDEED